METFTQPVPVVIPDVGANNVTSTAITSPARVRGNIFPNGDLDFYSSTANAGDRVYAAVRNEGKGRLDGSQRQRIIDLGRHFPSTDFSAIGL
ncbi:MAG: hypothetical protein AB7J13_12325 [Pyrinomonadaceae bacterium]